MKNKSLSFISLLLINYHIQAIATETNEDIMVITAAGFSQQLRNAPASITVITREQLEQKQVQNLNDAVKGIEGVSITGPEANKQDITIRGLPAEYTLILVDGRRQNSRESRPNGSNGFESGFIPPISAIERIEVIRGPMSSLYGSDAMGGVINIITRKVNQSWINSSRFDTTFQEKGKFGNIYGVNTSISGPLIDNILGLQLFAKADYRPEDKIIGGHNKNDNKAFTAKFTYTPTENQDVILEAGRSVQKRRSTPGKSIADYTIRGNLKQPNPKTDTNNERNHWSLSHMGRWDFATSELSIYQEKARRSTKTQNLDKTTGQWTGSYSDRKPEITNSVFDAKLTLPLPSNMITIGGQYQHAKLNDTSTTGKGRSRPATLKSHQQALFTEDEFSITDELILTGGLRLDHHEKYGYNWNPRGYLVYYLTDEVTLRGGIAKAFRAPTLRELSPEYGTATQGGAGIMYGNPDLKPETSINQEIGIAYDHSSGFTMALTLFNTDFKNKLSSYATGTKDPITKLNLYKFDNVGKANIKGIEVASGIPLATNWKFDVNYTYLNSKRKSNDEFFGSGTSLKGEPLTQTPKHSANAKLDWQVNESLSAFSRLNYTGRQIWAAQRNSYTGPRYRASTTTADIGANYRITKSVRLHTAVLNVLNKTNNTINTAGGNWLVEDGRRYWLGVNVDF